MDAETEQRILRNLEPWLADQTVIIIAHRLATLSQLAQQIVMLDKEGVVEQGTHRELMSQGGWYTEMVRR